MLILYTTVLLLIISFIAKAFMDLSSDNKFDSIYWNKGKSWIFKYKIPFIRTDKKLWYYLWLYKPVYKEKFPYSSTLLVSFIDGWHFLQLICFNSLFIALSINISSDLFTILVTFILIKALYGIFFNIFYK